MFHLRPFLDQGLSVGFTRYLRKVVDTIWEILSAKSGRIHFLSLFFVLFLFFLVSFATWRASQVSVWRCWIDGDFVLWLYYTFLWLNEYTHQEKNHEYITFLDKETHNHSNKVIIVVKMIILTLGSQMQAKIAFQAFLQFLTSAAFRSRWSRSTSELSSSGSVVC